MSSGYQLHGVCFFEVNQPKPHSELTGRKLKEQVKSWVLEHKKNIKLSVDSFPISFKGSVVKDNNWYMIHLLNTNKKA